MIQHMARIAGYLESLNQIPAEEMDDYVARFHPDSHEDFAAGRASVDGVADTGSPIGKVVTNASRIA
jgi:hypothetical protein